MSKTGAIVVFSGILFLVVTALRFTLFMSYIQIKKESFRESTLLNGSLRTEQVQMPAAELYKQGVGIEWKEKGKEVVLNGEYFEVVNVTINGGFAILTVLRDSEENSAFNTYYNTEKGVNEPAPRSENFLFNVECEPISRRYTGPEFRQLSTAIPIFDEKLLPGFQSRLIQPPQGC